MTMAAHPKTPRLQRPNDSPSTQPNRRARLACLKCRRRKVRCNIKIYGRPCTNCVLDSCECVTSHRTRKMAFGASQIDSENDIAQCRKALHGTRSLPREATSNNQLMAAANRGDNFAEILPFGHSLLTHLELFGVTNITQYSRELQYLLSYYTQPSAWLRFQVTTMT